MQDKNSKSLFGIDINEYTQNVDFDILQRQIDFLYLRSSGSGTGRFRVDKRFLEFAKRSREIGIPVGAYHFAVPSYDLKTAEMQCDDFIELLQKGFGRRDYGDLFPVVDVEMPLDKSKISTIALVEWIDTFRKRFEKKTRRRLMLYTGLFFIKMYEEFKVQGKGYPLKNMPLWLAMYTKIPANPRVPPDIGGWKKWRMWQYSESQIVKGTGNPVDANWGPNYIELLMQPDSVSGLNARIYNGRIEVYWQKNKEVDLLGYNIFINNEWVGTADLSDTSYVINIDGYKNLGGKDMVISMEAFDYDGETSKIRSKILL